MNNIERKEIMMKSTHKKRDDTKTDMATGFLVSIENDLRTAERNKETRRQMAYEASR